MKALDLRGLNPAPVTPFTLDGAVDFAAIQRPGCWLGSIDGVKSLVVLGHAGEGTFLTQDEQARVIRRRRPPICWVGTCPLCSTARLRYCPTSRRAR